MIISIENIRFNSIELLDLDGDHRNARISFPNESLILSQFDTLQGQRFPKHGDQIIKIHLLNKSDKSIFIPRPSPGSRIIYSYDYDKILEKEYEKNKGADGFIFINKDTINKQRSVCSYLLKEIGNNLLKGRSIMNISLPINIFDKRTLLELWIGQNGYASVLLESGGIINNPIEQLKYTACFALTKFYLSGAQLKPFNPIIGETFQANIGNSHFYLEQTSHHPPISNFYGFGRNYKIYGWNESSAETGPNSVEILYKGNMIVEYQNGTKNTVIYPSMKLGGTMIGQRILKFKGKVVIIDKENDLICIAKIDPDERQGIEKISKKKLSFPDYVKGVITSLSKNITVRRKQYHVINKQKFIFSILEGEFTNKISFDGNTYWEKRDNTIFKTIYRQNFTLPSDSYFREDLFFFRQNDLDLAQKYKMKLEEGQRKDEKLRELFRKNKKIKK